jgi:perosamine synthetase
LNKVLYTKPSVGDLEVEYALDAVRNGWGEKCYDYIVRFERDFSRYMGVDFSIATSSCTGALHMGMHALGIGPGDEVILADINWVATASPIVHLGATPVYVDILKDSWCLDPQLVESAITPKTKAIVAVHLYGNLADMNALLEIGERHGIPIIEDAAEAIGSIYHGRRAGSMGSFGVFSFHGTKTLTTGEGGMFVTNDPELYERVLTLSNHGRARNESRQFWPETVGFKYKMSNVQAAIGCAQLERLDDLVGDKRRIFQTYSTLLQELPIAMNPEPQGCVNGYWMPTVVVSEGTRFNRQFLLDSLKNEGVDARIFFWPLSSTPVPGRKFQQGFSNSEKIHLRAINLPSPYGLETREILRVTDHLKAALLGVQN